MSWPSRSPGPVWRVASSVLVCWVSQSVEMSSFRGEKKNNKTNIQSGFCTSASVLRGSRMSLSICTSYCISSLANLLSASPHTSIILLFTHTQTSARGNPCGFAHSRGNTQTHSLSVRLQCSWQTAFKLAFHRSPDQTLVAQLRAALLHGLRQCSQWQLFLKGQKNILPKKKTTS